MEYITLAIDTTSYPNMVLKTQSLNGTNVACYHLLPNEGYVIHGKNHEGCIIADPDEGIEGKCLYSRMVGLPPATDLSIINDRYEAVIEDSVEKAG